MNRPPQSHILPVLDRLLAAGMKVSWHPYYSGPFQQYEYSTTLTHVWDVAPTIDMLPDDAKAILEIGSGSGRLTIPIAQSGRAVTALDNSYSAIEKLKVRSQALGLSDKIRAIECDVASYEEPAFYDAVMLVGLSVHVMELGTVRGAIDLAKRMLTSDGRFCLNIFSDGSEDIFTRMMPEEGSVSLYLYRDENEEQRIIISSGRYNPITREITQNWIIQANDGMIHAATMISNLWRPSDITQIILDAGFREVKEEMHRFGDTDITESVRVAFLTAII